MFLDVHRMSVCRSLHPWMHKIHKNGHGMVIPSYYEALIPFMVWFSGQNRDSLFCFVSNGMELRQEVLNQAGSYLNHYFMVSSLLRLLNPLFLPENSQEYLSESQMNTSVS